MMKTTSSRILMWVLLIVLVAGAATLYADRYSRKGYLGVSVDRLSHEDRRETGLSHGVIVEWVEDDSPADEAGIEEDDVIMYFNGVKIRRPEDLTDVVRDTEPESKVKVTLNRDGDRMDLDVEVGRLRTRSAYVYGWDDDHRVIRIGGGRAYLGVQLNELNDDLGSYFGVKADEGVLILEVEDDSPAEGAGLKAGDVIVTLDGAEVGDPRDVQDILSDFEEGDEVELTIMRQRRQQRITVDLDEHPDYHGVHIWRSVPGKHYRHMDIDIDIPEIEDIEIREFDDHRLHERIEERIHDRLRGVKHRIKQGLHRIDEKLEVIREMTFI